MYIPYKHYLKLYFYSFTLKPQTVGTLMGTPVVGILLIMSISPRSCYAAVTDSADSMAVLSIENFHTSDGRTFKYTEQS